MAYCHADEDATWVPTQEREIGFVFQSYALFKHMTCAQNIAFGPSIRKMGIDIDSRSVDGFWALVLEAQCHTSEVLKSFC